MSEASPELAPASVRLAQAQHPVRRGPNPVFIRDLTQGARLGRTPAIVALVPLMITLLLASIGGMAAGWSDPALIGSGIFQTFFSVAFFVMSWIGPSIAAASIASERSGRTWEALLLTGLGPRRIVHGKFLAALAYSGTFLVALLPVGMIPFLFGGVSSLEVLAGFVLLFAVTILGIGLGLALSSTTSSQAASVLLALLIAVLASFVVFLWFGVGGSFVAASVWPEVPGGPPIWWPTALARAPFELRYVALLVLLPLVQLAVPTWFFYEASVANASTSTDDQSTGLRVWFIGASVLLALQGCAVALVASFAPAAVYWMLFFVGFVAFVFAGEPFAPSRRVRIHWERAHASFLRRALGPGLVSSLVTVMLIAVLAISATVGAGALHLWLEGLHTTLLEDLMRLVAIGAYAIGHVALIVGLVAVLRRVSLDGIATRFSLVGVLFLFAVVPWVLYAILDRTVSEDLARAIAMPSVLFPIVFWRDLGSSPTWFFATLGASAAFTAVGLLALTFGSLGIQQKIRLALEREAELAAKLAVEDEPSEDAAGDAPPNEYDDVLPAKTASAPAPTGPYFGDDEPAPTTASSAELTRDRDQEPNR